MSAGPGLETLVNSAAARRADARVLLFPNEQSSMSADLLKRAGDNFKRIHATIDPRGTVTPHALQFFSAEGRRIASQNAAGKLDLSVKYASDDKRWVGSIFALNVTDQHIKSNVIVVSALIGSLALGQYQPPRQVGASIGYHY